MKNLSLLSLSGLITITACTTDVNGLLNQTKDGTKIESIDQAGNDITFKIKIDPAIYKKGADLEVSIVNRTKPENPSLPYSCTGNSTGHSICKDGDTIVTTRHPLKSPDLTKEIVLTANFLKVNDPYAVTVSGPSFNNCDTSTGIINSTIDKTEIVIDNLLFSSSSKDCSTPDNSQESIEPLPSGPPQGITVGEPNPNQPMESIPAEDFTSLDKTVQSNMIGIDKLIIKDEKEWNEIWVQHVGSSKPLPSIDFNSEMVIALFMGQQATAGFEIEIVNITKTDSQMTVHFKENKPAIDALVAQVITSPAHLVKVKKFEGHVVFKAEGKSNSEATSTLEKVN